MGASICWLDFDSNRPTFIGLASLLGTRVNRITLKIQQKAGGDVEGRLPAAALALLLERSLENLVIRKGCLVVLL